jgi:hypothetical protein
MRFVVDAGWRVESQSFKKVMLDIIEDCIMGHRSDRFRIRREDAAEAKASNRVYKSKERERRDSRMMAKVNAGSLPYTPVVMSWLSDRLDKPASKITQEDLSALK